MSRMKSVEENCAVVILAAGLGTRMKSDKPKVLHEVSGKPIVMYVVETAKKVAGDNVILVVGYQAEKVREVVSEKVYVKYAFQERQLGTGHAVLCALPHIPIHIQEVVILCGDVPLLTSNTVSRLLYDHIKAERDISILAVEVDNPKGYGRVILDENRQAVKIVEEVDATEDQKGIKTINSGIYCVKKGSLIDMLGKIKTTNAKGELYLTDIIEIGFKEQKVVGVLFGENADEIIGVNDNHDLKRAETILHKRLSKKP